MIGKINTLFQKVVIVLKTYPLVVLTSLIVGIWNSFWLENEWQIESIFNEFITSSITGNDSQTEVGNKEENLVHILKKKNN